jgi:hypothetical protein
MTQISILNLENQMKKSSLAIASLLAVLAAPALADGNNNASSIDQVGTNVLAGVTQFGTSATNNVDVQQGGQDNTNAATISQNGGGLSATVVQN